MLRDKHFSIDMKVKANSSGQASKKGNYGNFESDTSESTFL
jgi:hypothetical protein